MSNAGGASVAPPAQYRRQTMQKRVLQVGMTMMELLAVLVIIGVVMGVVGSKFFGQAEEAKRKAAKIEISQIGQSLDLYKLEIGRYPTTSEGLQALITAPAGTSNWNGPYCCLLYTSDAA